MQLKALINWRHASVWITSGMRSKKVTAALSKHCRQKATKTAFTGLLIKTNTYVNPEYSFADCDTDTVITSVQEHKTLPGCRISLKLATKDADGQGIREYTSASMWQITHRIHKCYVD
jgi:hypothetical protein